MRTANPPPGVHFPPTGSIRTRKPLPGVHFPPTGSIRTRTPASPRTSPAHGQHPYGKPRLPACTSRPRAASVRQTPPLGVHFPPTGSIGTRNPASPRTAPAHGRHPYTNTRHPAYISRPRAAAVRENPPPRAHFPPTGSIRTANPASRRTLPAHGRHDSGAPAWSAGAPLLRGRDCHVPPADNPLRPTAPARRGEGRWRRLPLRGPAPRLSHRIHHSGSPSRN